MAKPRLLLELIPVQLAMHNIGKNCRSFYVRQPA
jgi:hypothetical protein